MGGEVSRRRALQIAALGAAGAVVGGVGTWRSFVAPTEAGLSGRSGELLQQPRVLTSSNGILRVRLRASPGAPVAGRGTQALGYNGTIPGPTLRVRPGDRLEVALVNGLGEPTNLHTHGLHVSPGGVSDNVFRRVGPGETARYEFDLPHDHPRGTFWYHPHHHGMVADQVFGGLYGTLIVTGDGEPQVDRERVLVISDITLTGTGHVAQASRAQKMAGRQGELVLLNGQLQPRIDLGAGGLERWRVVNACVSRFLRLQLDEHTLGFLGYDGQALTAPRQRDAVALAPGNRADLLVRARGAGRFRLRTGAVDRGGMGMMGGPSGVTSGATDLATVQVSGGSALPSAAPGRSAGRFTRPPDLRDARVDRHRATTFTMGMGSGMGMGGMTFGFDAQAFDPSRIDQRLRLGTVEEWTIGNDTPMDHPFHLHVWPVQVIEAPDHDPTGPPDWRDVVVVPPRGRVRVRLRIDDFNGRTVYHCHILDHEDLGMMAVVQASN